MAEIILFEDDGYRKLGPLTLNRPGYELKTGITSLAAKIIREYKGATVSYHVRTALADYYQEQVGDAKVNAAASDAALLVNGRIFATGDLAGKIPVDGPDAIFMQGDTVVAARLSGANLAAVKFDQPIAKSLLPSVPEQTVEGLTLIVWPWDLVHHNPDEITREFKILGNPGAQEGKVYEGVHILAAANVYIAPGASVKPGVVLDAEGGPIFIDEGAKIFPQAVIEGPCYIGKKTAIKISAKIYEGTSIGEVCKVGGEVEESIIHSYSNKQHDGFLGHAYLGMWVNLGADTNNSDLKNDYGFVKCVIDGEMVNTGSQFVGLTMGDYSKSGINTMFNTGTVVGVGCNMYGAGLPPTAVPSFSWGGGAGLMEYRVDKFLSVAKAVMARRDKELSPAEEALLRKIHEETAEERKAVFGA